MVASSEANHSICFYASGLTGETIHALSTHLRTSSGYDSPSRLKQSACRPRVSSWVYAEARKWGLSGADTHCTCGVRFRTHVMNRTAAIWLVGGAECDETPRLELSGRRKSLSKVAIFKPVSWSSLMHACDTCPLALYGQWSPR